MSQVTTPTEPGWLPDPSGRYEWRYWDGGWTNRVANSTPTEPAPAPEPKPMTARDAVPRVPFGTDLAPATGTPPPAPRTSRRSPWAVIVDFFRSFADQPESYHHPLARAPMPPDPRGEHLVITAPGNYGRAMIVALAAIGIVGGAYLPWISGTIGLAHFARSGFDDGLGAGYTIGAMALAISAMLSVQMRPFRWLTIVLSFVITGFVVRDVLHSYDLMQQMNQSRAVDANVGWGLWIMIVASSISMIAAVRLSEEEKIG